LPGPTGRISIRRRLAAIVALLVGSATLVLGIAVSVSEFPRGLILLAVW
jgi:hypothetical protein